MNVIIMDTSKNILFSLGKVRTRIFSKSNSYFCTRNIFSIRHLVLICYIISYYLICYCTNCGTEVSSRPQMLPQYLFFSSENLSCNNLMIVPLDTAKFYLERYLAGKIITSEYGPFQHFLAIL